MNTRCTLHVRVAAFCIMMAALFLVPSAGHAQYVDCSVCDHFTFAVNADLKCAVTICYTPSKKGPVICETVRPGQSITIPCPLYQAWLNTCSGPYYFMPASSDVLCSPPLKFAAGCCGRLCHAEDGTDRCNRLEVLPLPCDTKGCP